MNFKKIADTNFNLLPLFQEKLSIDYNFCILLGHYSGAISLFSVASKIPNQKHLWGNLPGTFF